MNFLDFYDAINFTLASEIIGLYTFNVDSDNGVPFTVQNNDTIDFTSTNITVSNINSAISFNLPVTGVTAGAYTAANITVDSFGRITDAADGASGPGGTGTTNFVTKWVDATTLGDSVIFDNGTNVGIGTSSPSVKLDIAQSADNQGIKISGFDDQSSSNIRLYTSNFGNNEIVSSNALRLTSGASAILKSTGSYLRLQAGGITNQIQVDINYIKFDSSGNEIMRIDGTNERVGIGTTSPSSKLHVEGTLQVIETNPITAEPNGSRIIAAIDSRGGGDTGGLGIYTGDTNNDEAALLITNYLDAEKFRILGASGDIRSAGLIRSTAYGGGNVTGTATYNLEVDSNGNIIETAAGGGLDNWTLTGNNIYNNNSGNVGIGTTSPGTKLDVSGQVRSNDSFLLQSGTTAIGSIRNQAGALDIRGNSTRNVSIGSVTTPQALFVEGTNGNVGIGTTAPAQKLDVVGNIKTSQEFQVFTGTTDIGQISNLSGALNIQGTSTRDVSLGSDTNPQSMFIEGVNGNVGIGTTTPSEKLEVIGKAIIRKNRKCNSSF